MKKIKVVDDAYKIETHPFRVNFRANEQKEFIQIGRNYMEK